MTVELWLEHWWVLPAAIAFATVAIGSGVSGALFFSPFFMLVVGLEPAQAIGAGLLTEVFGMGNGLRSYIRQRVVDFATVRWLLLGAVPLVAVGAALSHVLDPGLVKGIFGAGLIVLAAFLLYYPAPSDCTPGEKEGDFLARKNRGQGTTRIVSRDGEVFEYPTCFRPPGLAMASVGGLLTGLISAGLPEIVTTQLILRCRVPARVAVATSVVALAITAVVGAAIHAVSAEPVWYVVAWSVPGVLIGSTLGSRVGHLLPESVMETVLGIVFGLVGVLVLATEFVVPMLG